MWVTINGFKESIPGVTSIAKDWLWEHANKANTRSHIIVELNHRFVYQKDLESTC